MPDATATIDLMTEKEYIEMFRELLVNAVNMRCKGVNSLGSELSGGLDSSAVTGIAADAARTENIPFTAFSNVFPEDTGIEFRDEREFIRDMLAFKQINGVNIDRLDIPVTDLLRYTLDIQGAFIQQNYNVFNYNLFKTAGYSGTRVLLSGFGGDELVSARVNMPWNELIGNRQWKNIKEELFYRGITPKSLLKPGILAARYLYSRFHHADYHTGVFTPELLEKRLGNLPLHPAYVEMHHLEKRFRDKYKIPFREKLSSRQLFRITMDHIPQRMEYCYAAAAQFGMEYRYPLLDVNLVLACLAFPPGIKQHQGINRYLFRQAIAGYVPEVIRQRDDKSGSTIPHTYYSLIREKDLIMGLIRDCSGVPFVDKIFDLKRFPQWYERLVKRDSQDLNYLNPGLFYTYLMMMIYFKSNE
jgi:asparagine synthase (glutamine-hydrolysing)